MAGVPCGAAGGSFLREKERPGEALTCRAALAGLLKLIVLGQHWLPGGQAHLQKAAGDLRPTSPGKQRILWTHRFFFFGSGHCWEGRLAGPSQTPP